MTIKRRTRRLLGISLSMLIALLFLGVVIGRSDLITDFQGDGHTGCHDGTVADSTGTITYTVTPSQNMTPGQSFVIELNVVSWTDSTGEDGSIGFPDGTPGLADNKQFTYNTSFYEKMLLDASGNDAIQG